MKFLKIFKKKSPTPLPTSNLICNIHWAEVQRELSQEIKETSISKPIVNNKNVSHFAPAPVNHSNCWSSDSSNTNSNSRHSWSSVSLSSSTKTTSAEPFPEENFSRASSPGTEPVKSSMIDDISLVDVEQYEERRQQKLAKVRRKVSRVDSLKKFLFSSRLEEKKTKQMENSWFFNRAPIMNDHGYKASCLEVHDRWLGVQQNKIEEEDMDDDDKLSCLVNINMDIRSDSRCVMSDSPDSRCVMGNSDDKRYDTDVMSYHMNTSHETSFDVDSDLTYIKAKDNQIIDAHIEPHNKRKSAINKNLNKNEDCVMQSKHTRSNLDKSHIRFAKDANVKYEESVPSSGYDSDCLQVSDSGHTKRVSRSVSQPSHQVRKKLLQNLEKPQQKYLRMTVYKPEEENLGVIITSSTNTNGFIIAHIDPGSVIHSDGRFRTGDKIIRINGHNLMDLTINQVREILKNSGNQVEIDVLRSNSSERKTGAKLSKSESLRIFRATPAVDNNSTDQKITKSNVVTERIITPKGNLTKTIITISGSENLSSKPVQWNAVDIDIDTGDKVSHSGPSDVSIHYVRFLMGHNCPGVGVVLEGSPDEGIYVEHVLEGGQAHLAPRPGLLPGFVAQLGG